MAAVDFSVAIREQQRAHAFGMACQQELGDGTAAVAGDYIRAGDIEAVHQREQHAELVFRADRLAVGDLRVAHAEEIRGDAAAIRRQPG